MPWQRQVADIALEIDPLTGKLVYREVILTVPRQSGKTTLLLSQLLERALDPFFGGRQNIKYTAQTGSDARKKWMDDWLPELQESAFHRYFRPRLTNGHEGLIFTNGSLQGLLATTKKSGHGGSLDLGILDEAFAHPDGRLEQAIKPAMITRPQPQLWVVSTAGTPEDSPYLLAKVEAGRELAAAGVTHSVAYFEWSADDEEDPSDPSDPETWWSCMPALGWTTTQDAIAADFASMELSEFRRAYLNQWVTSLVDPVIPIDVWKKMRDKKSAMADPIVLSFDVTPDRARAAICAAGHREDGLPHVEMVESRPGTIWLPERLKELVDKHRPSGVYCDPRGPAGALIPELKKLGVEVEVISTQEMAQACGILYDASMEGKLRHLGQPELVTALDGAIKRNLGDSWVWSRRSSAIDISPLVGVTAALFGLQTAEPSGPSNVWDLNQIVADLRKEQSGEKPETEEETDAAGVPIHRPTFVPFN